MATSKTAITTKKSPFPFLMNDNYISIVLQDGTFSLSNSHPTFDELRNALAKSNWKRVPHLVTVAAKIANKSHGNVTVNSKGVFYKGRSIDSSLTKRMLVMLKERKDIGFMIKFMDNLYENPSEQAQSELFDFLRTNELGITDDGCFVAYKIVNQNYTDCHSGKFDNTPGQVLVMPRTAVDPNRNNHCSRGFHFCAMSYLGSAFGSGGRLLQVKINPKDVVSIPSDYGFAKGRTWKYEVVKELKSKHEAADSSKDEPSMIQSVVPIAKERKDLLLAILGHKVVARGVKKGRIKESSLRKWNYGQLAKFFAKLPQPPAPEQQSKLFQNTLRVLREQNGIGLREIAEELDLSYKAVWAAERSTQLRQSTVDRYIEAIDIIKARREREAVEVED